MLEGELVGAKIEAETAGAELTAATETAKAAQARVIAAETERDESRAACVDLRHTLEAYQKDELPDCNEQLEEAQALLDEKEATILQLQLDIDDNSAELGRTRQVTVFVLSGVVFVDFLGQWCIFSDSDQSTTHNSLTHSLPV